MTEQRTSRLSKLGLIVGAIGLLAAVVTAHQHPTTGYELSLYQSTPMGVWLGVAVAGLVSVVTATWGRGRIRDGGLLLGTGSALTVFSLPILRGYFFYGSGDSLSHLGWMREIAAGQFAPVDLLYPTIHVSAVSVAAVGDVPMMLAAMYVVLVLFPLLFLVFVPLSVQLLDGTPSALVVGLFAAVLFIPINHISTHPSAHPASQAILFVPVALYVMLRYVTSAGTAPSGPSLVADGGEASDASGASSEALRSDGGRGRRWVTPMGVLAVLISATVVLNHPQQALNVVVLFGTVAVTQAVYRRLAPGHPIARHRPLYLQTAVITGFFLLWAPRFPTVSGSVSGLLQRVLAGPPVAGDLVSAKSASITAVGGDLAVVFLRLFLPALVLSVLAGLLLIGVLRSELRSGGTRADGLLVYLVAGLVPLGLIFLVFFGFGYDDMYFRYQGFIMVPVTVLGAVALARTLKLGAEGWSPVGTMARSLVVILFVLLLPVAGMAIHPSPHIYQPTPHVAESQVSGYEASFVHRVPGQEFVGLRSGPRRFVDAVYGTERAETTLDFPGYREGVPEAVFDRGNYTTYYEEDRYLALSPVTYDREVVLYTGFRYAREGFTNLARTPGVSRIRASEGFQLYLIDVEAEE